MLQLENIKLIIWDLDNTFWNGVLSEETVSKIDENIAFVKAAVDRGIMNSICSKNDMEPVRRLLSSDEFERVWDYFVFPSVDWTAKAPRIWLMLEDMALRAENVLFLDDEAFNLREVKYELPEIMTGTPSVIKELAPGLAVCEKEDREHVRLSRYRMLEKKRTEQKKASSNLRFLIDSDIQIEFLSDCDAYFERVCELLRRTNQLNFTKVRLSEDEVRSLLADDGVECRLVRLTDRYGDYGIAGFYAMEKSVPHTLIHFLFSCRALGMGVEQYVYQRLGYPPLAISGDTAVTLRAEEAVTWIKEKTEDKEGADECGTSEISQEVLGQTKLRVLLKGPCDMTSMLSYLKKAAEYEMETNFVDDRGVIVAGSNNSTHIYELYHMPLVSIRDTIKDAPFLSEADFLTFMFTDPYDVVVFSTLSEGHTGIYRHRKNDVRICFGSCKFDLTKPENRQKFISREYVNHNYPFTPDILREFADNFEFEGHLLPELAVRNLLWMRSMLPAATKLVLVLGSEVEAENNKLEFAEHAPIYRELNRLIEQYFGMMDNVVLINITDFITGQDCFEDCTNHYAKKVYKELAERINDICFAIC